MYTIISIQMDSSHVNVNFTHFILVFGSNKVLHVSGGGWVDVWGELGVQFGSGGGGWLYVAP